MKLRSREKSAHIDGATNGLKDASSMPSFKKEIVQIKEEHPCDYFSLDAFCEQLNLFSKTKKTVKVEEVKEKVEEVECEEISPVDDSNEKLPDTPRSNKSLLSVLSKDKPSQSAQRQLILQEGITNDNSENDASDEEEEDEMGGIKFGRKAPQFHIDISSPMGGKINKFCDSSEFMDKNDYGEYCLYDKEHIEKRLRERTNPPIFYKNKRANGTFIHKYKFNKVHKKEFFESLRTGIDKHSRQMRDSLKKVKLTLFDMEDSDIRKMKYHKKRIYLDPSFARNLFVGRSMSELKKIIAVNPGLMQSLWMRQINTGFVNSMGTPPSIYLNTAVRSFKRPELKVDPIMKPIILPFSPSFLNGRFPGPQMFAQNRNNINQNHQSRFNSYPPRPSPPVRMHSKGGQIKGGTADDAIALSSDEEDNNSTHNVRKTSNNDMGVQPRTLLNHLHRPVLQANAASRSIPAGLPAVHFTCHLCYSEIVCNIASTDYIKQHFSERHNVTNIKVLQQRDASGQVVLSIVESNPSSVSQKSNVKNVPMHSNSQNSIRHSTAPRPNVPSPIRPPHNNIPTKKPVPEQSTPNKDEEPEVICID